jgi:hypothetical protein
MLPEGQRGVLQHRAALVEPVEYILQPDDLLLGFAPVHPQPVGDVG